MASPALQSMIKAGACPMLEQVEAAKSEVSELCMCASATSEFLADAQIYMDALSNLETGLGALSQESTKMVFDAMLARDQDKNGVCRGLCQQVMHNEHAVSRSKIMANKILACLPATTRACAIDYIAEAQRLVRMNIDRDPCIPALTGAVQIITQSIMSPNERIRPIT